MTVLEDLIEKHKEMELPKLRLCARMVASGVHESTEGPLHDAPMVTGTVPQCARRESMHDVVIDAAKAVAQVFTPPTHTLNPWWPLLLPHS